MKISENLYESLKPAVFGDNKKELEKRGRRYDLRGLNNLLKGNKKGQYQFHIDEGTMWDLAEYRRELEKKKEEHLSEKGLESKTI